jgi:3',5'-cyclic AMP phosphodiesterase CpdA
MKRRSSPALASLLTFAAASALAASCSAPADGSNPTPLPPLRAVKLTTEQRYEPARAVDVDAPRPPSVPANLEAMLREGYGVTRTIGGEPLAARTLDGSSAPALPAGSTLLTRFVHLADLQIADDESPARVARLDSPGAAGGAYRPQEAFGCALTRAAVRTINAIHAATPLDAVVLGGDNADNAQTNEVDWVLALLDGTASVHCDSGNDDDPVPGPDNDPKDPIASDGLRVPWRWVTGNHDILNQGTIRLDVSPDEPIGTTAAVGTRDWSRAGGPIRSGDFVVPDPQRAYLPRTALMRRVASAGDGHGLGPKEVASGRADYTFDLGARVRVVVLDTAAETGSAEGVLRAGVIDGFLRPALERAKADGKLVIVTSHHASSSLTDGGETGGTKQPDSITPTQFRGLLASYPNVLAHLAAHSHLHTTEVVAGAHPYWEIKTASLLDFPNQSKLVEVWETPEGAHVLRTVAFDYADEGDPLGREARAIAVADYTCGYTPDGRGEAGSRNVELWVPKR